jgi:peptidyl-dipeptidase A
MSVECNAYWYETVHHELGHIYYDLSYSNPDVPMVLRRGADRSFHEAIGSLMGLAAMQPRFAAAVGLVPEGEIPDPIELLFKEALNAVAFIPWASGVMTRFEYELYAKELPPGLWNQRWWELKRHYQGIVPPSPRGEEHCDPATKTHIIDDAAQYYDYALSYVMLFQLHDFIAREILHEDPHDTNYFGRKDAGDFLRSILRPGAASDGRSLLREKIGQDLSARAMVEYFDPLMEWLERKNTGRSRTLPES